MDAKSIELVGEKNAAGRAGTSRNVRPDWVTESACHNCWMFISCSDNTVKLSCLTFFHCI